MGSDQNNELNKKQEKSKASANSVESENTPESKNLATLSPPPFQLSQRSRTPVQKKEGEESEEQETTAPDKEYDFSDVNIHPNSQKATDLGAQAYTQGTDVHFAPGKFNKDTTSGKQLISHELAHVVQQKKGIVSPTTNDKGTPINDDKNLEQEADIAGRMMKHRLPSESAQSNDGSSSSAQLKKDDNTKQGDSGYFNDHSPNTIQCCGREPDFTPPTGKKITKLKGTFGQYTVDHGLHTVPKDGKHGFYEIRITMTPNQQTEHSKKIGWIQTVRRSPGPGKKWSTSAKDPGMSKERAARATKEGWRVDRGNAKKDKTPFYGTFKDKKGKHKAYGTSRFGKFGGASAMLYDKPGVIDPTALEFMATAMDPEAGFAYDAIHWGLSYDSSARLYKEITPKVIPGNSKMLKSRDKAFDKWNKSDGKAGSGIDPVLDFKPPVGSKITNLKGKYGEFKVKHGLYSLPTAAKSGQYEFDLEMTPNKKTRRSRIGYVQTVRRSEGEGKKWATKATDQGMSKEREARATKDGWRVDRGNAKRDKTSFYGMQKQKSGRIKSLGYAKLGKYKGTNPQMSDYPAVVDPGALEFVATPMDINAGTQFGAVRWGMSYDSSQRSYKEITPTLISDGDPILKQREEAMKKWNQVDAAKGNDTYPVPGIK